MRNEAYLLPTVFSMSSALIAPRLNRVHVRELNDDDAVGRLAAPPSQVAAVSVCRRYGFSAKTVIVGFPPPISGASW
jgi:hypothetical protein